MKPFIIQALLCCLATAQAVAQVAVRGSVREKNSQQPVPYAHVRILGSNTGTVTNLEGGFVLQIPASQQAAVLEISAVGFEPLQLRLADRGTGPLTVLLVESAVNLAEITVTSLTPAQIVAEAYRNIPNNYPETPSLFTGFYRESNYQTFGDSAEVCYYVIEAVTLMNKPSYAQTKPEGDIKLEQVRKHLFVPESKFTRWYAGAFTPIRFDVAKKRFEYLNPDRQDLYDYAIESYTTYYGKPVYVIRFSPLKNGHFEGLVYIEMDSYAIVKAEYALSPRGLSKENSGGSTKILQRSYKANYYPVDGKWYLQSVWQQAQGKDGASGGNFRYVTEYATTGLDTNKTEPFDYADKIQFGEIFLTKEDPYNENFWQDFNIVAETRTLQDLLVDTAYQARVLAQAATDLKKSNPAEKIRKAPRFQPVFTFVNPYFALAGASGFQTSYTNESGLFAISPGFSHAGTRLAWGSGYGLEYRFWKNAYVSLNAAFGFGSFRYFGHSAGLGYSFLLTDPKKRPARLYFGLDYAFVELNNKLGYFENGEGRDVEGTVFETDLIRADFFARQIGVSPKVGFTYELNRSFRAFAEAGLFVKAWRRDGLYFTDDTRSWGFGRNKQKRVSPPNERLSLLSDGEPGPQLSVRTPVYISLGVKGFFRR